MHILQTKLKLEAEEKDRLEFLNRAQTYKNEKIIEDNLSDNAKAKIEICNVVINKPNKRYENIFLKLILGAEIQQTSVLNDPKDLVWNQMFELYIKIKFSKVNNSRENLYFEICLYDQIKKKEELIGKVKFPLEKLESQDEFEIDIGIPDDYKADEYLATIKTKLQFIRSYYKYYQVLATKSENLKKELESSLNDYQKLYHNLNGIDLLIKNHLDSFLN
jgi:hypothetical protein